MNTPDTEWETVDRYSVETGLLKRFFKLYEEGRKTGDPQNFIDYFKAEHYLLIEVGKAISSRDTYLKERVRSLMDYIEHDNQCIISQAHRGRPTNDGGYETQYGDKWYRSPDKPECDCGLDTLLDNLK